MAATDARMARVALSWLVEPGNRDLGMLVDTQGPVEALARARAGDVPRHLAAACSARAAERDPIAAAEEALRRIERLDGRLITPDDEEWPKRLDDLRSIPSADDRRADRDVYPPLCLWARGPLRLGETADRSVSVVGARAASPYGHTVALELAYGLATREWAVISGGALGIDGQAHRGALAPGGMTIAVLASGVDRFYPQSHASLLDRISQEGLVISEWPPGAAPHRHRFLIRNRVIAALARGTVVVEASARSGAKQTANRSQQLGRPTMAVPGPVTSAMSVGTHQLLRRLDTRLVTSAPEIIEEVGHIGDDLAPVERGPARDRDRLDAVVGQVLDGVPARHGAGPMQVAAAAGVGLRVALQALPRLKDDGWVIEEDGLWRTNPRGRKSA
jgi:DNA processing protein